MSIEIDPTALRPYLIRRLRELDRQDDAPFIDISSDISLETEVSQLPLTRRAELALDRLGHRCLGDVLSVDLVDLFSAPNVGVKTVREIKALLEAWHDRLTRIETMTEECETMDATILTPVEADASSSAAAACGTRSTGRRPSASPRRRRSERLE